MNLLSGRKRDSIFSRFEVWIRDWRSLVFLLLSALILYFPLPGMVISSLRTVDGDWSWQWYLALANNHSLQEAFFRSLGLAVASSALACLLALGVALSTALSGVSSGVSSGRRSRARRGEGWFQALTLLALVMPEIIFSLSLLTWFAQMSWRLSPMTLIIGHTTFVFSFALLLLHSRLQKLDPLQVEAAQDLGAEDRDLVLRVFVPWLTPALFAAVIVGALLSFDDFMLSFFLGPVGGDTLPVRLYTSVRSGYSPEISALATLMLLLSILPALMLLCLPSVRSWLRRPE